MFWNMERFTVILGLYTAAVIFTIIFPIGSEMVMHFGEVTDKDKTGFYVGMIAASLMLGRTVSSPIWGYLIDTWGRKPVTQLGMFAVVTLSILFGLCTSFYQAIFVRFLIGIFTPLMISSRTIIGEICRGQHLVLGMAWISMAWNIGSISGSFFGGILSNPYKKGYLKYQIFEKYPFLLCMMVPSVLAFISFILGHFYIKETLDKSQKITSLSKNRSICQIATNEKVFPALKILFLFSFNYTAFQEIITLLFWAHSASGGLEFSTDEIGYFLSITILLLLLYQKRLYTYLQKKYGLIKTVGKGFYFLVPTTIMIPIISSFSPSLFKILFLGIMCLIWYTADFVMFTSNSILLNNSVPNHELGRLNGFSMFINCSGRMCAPVIFGTIFSESIDSGLPKPLNTMNAFVILAVLQIFGIHSLKKMPTDNEKPFVYPDTEIALADISES